MGQRRIGSTRCRIQHRKHFSHLCTVKQARNESLKDFIGRWKKEVSNVYDFDGKAAVPIIIQALRSGEFYKHLSTHQVRDYDKLMRTANRFAGAEEADRRKREEEEGKGRNERPPPTNQGSVSASAKGGSREQYQERPRESRLVPLRHLTQLTHPISVILDQAEEMGIVQFPEECMKVSPKVDQSKYCQFHRQTGHDTDECIVLKRQIEELIQRRYFSQFVKRSGQQPRGQARPKNVWRMGDGTEPSSSGTKKKEFGLIGEEEEKEAEEDPRQRKKQTIH